MNKIVKIYSQIFVGLMIAFNFVSWVNSEDPAIFWAMILTCPVFYYLLNSNPIE